MNCGEPAWGARGRPLALRRTGSAGWGHGPTVSQDRAQLALLAERGPTLRLCTLMLKSGSEIERASGVT